MNIVVYVAGIQLLRELLALSQRASSYIVQDGDTAKCCSYYCTKPALAEQAYNSTQQLLLKELLLLA